MTKSLGGVLAALLALLLVWSFVIEPRFLLDTQELEAEIPHLPAAWEGQQVALLADFQVGMWWDNTGMVEKAVETAIEATPALVLIAGDFVYKPDSATVREAVALVRPLAEAGIPTYAVLGNHDFSMMKRSSEKKPAIARFLAAELEAAGIDVLENEAVTVPRDGEALHIVGVGSMWADEADPLGALSSVPDSAPRVVLMHNPVAFRDFPARSVPLALTAHTHGGQVRLPFTPTTSWLDIARDREVIADGWAADSIGAAGNRAYVNRGIGFSLIPARLFCRPELTLFTLTASEGDLPTRAPDA